MAYIIFLKAYIIQKQMFILNLMCILTFLATVEFTISATCISFLLMLQQITTNLVTKTTQNCYFLVLEVRSLEWVIGPCSFWKLQGRICFLAFSTFKRLLIFRDLWPFSPSSNSPVQHLLIYFSGSYTPTSVL